MEFEAKNAIENVGKLKDLGANFGLYKLPLIFPLLFL